MKKNKLIYIGAATLFCFSSCSVGQTGEPVRGDSTIRIAPSLLDIAWSRTADVTYDNFYSFQATCFNPAQPVINERGILLPYFEDVNFGKISSDVFVTAENGCEWPEQRESVDFIAFAPSRAAMAQVSDISPDDDSHFVIVNKSTFMDGKADYDYSLANIRIAADISRQYDFLTATGSGSKFGSINEPVKLPFRHGLSKVELRAWGDNPIYKIEIAGVRVGTVPLEGSYNLAPGDASASSWTVPEDAVRGRAEYIFGKQADEYSRSDAVVVIDKNAGVASNPGSDVSLMGEGGAAMMIPVSDAAWDRSEKNKARGTYFSVLMRVSNLKNDKQVAYPYADDKELMEKIWLAVTDEGLVAERLYRGDDGDFYTDKELKTLYAGDVSAVREYGWAAIPVDIDWEEGKHYVYTIDYSSGLGVKDPGDTNPGELILANPEVNIGVKVIKWEANKPIGTIVPRT